MNTKKAKALESFLNIAKERGYQVLGEYTGTHNKTLIKCPQTHEFQIEPNKFKRGQSCPRCVGRSPEKSKEDFYRIAIEKGYQVLGEYIKNDQKVEVICHEGHKITVIPNSFKVKEGGCAKCSKVCPIQAREEFQDMVKNRGFKLIGQYVDANKTKVELICPNGHNFFTLPSNFKKGHGCSKCANVSFEKSKEDFEKLIDELGFKILGKYTGNDKYTRVVCKEGHQVLVKPYHFKAGHHCKRCTRMCPEQASEELIKLAEERKYKVVGEYINSHTRIEMICPKGHDFLISPTHFKGGRECFICSESYGEQKIRNVLSRMGISFETQVRINSLPNRKYDFAFMNGNNKVFIEWDGGQHFEYVDIFHKDEDNFKEKQKIDIEKTKAVIDEGNIIIRIDYSWERKPENKSRNSLIVSDKNKYKWLLDSLE